MWNPLNTNDDSAKPYLCKLSFVSDNGVSCATIDTFLYKGYDWRWRRFASQEAAQKHCDKLNSK